MTQLSIRDRVFVLSSLNLNYKQIQDFLIFKYGIHMELNRIGNICNDYKPTVAVNKYLNGKWRVPKYLSSFAQTKGFKLIVSRPIHKNKNIKAKPKNFKLVEDIKIYQPSDKLPVNSASEFLRIVKEESIRIGSREAHLVYQNVKIRILGYD